MNELTLLGPDGRPIASDLESRASMDSVITEMFLRGVTVQSNAVNLTADNAFERQGWVFACVNVLARIVSTIPFSVVDAESGRTVEPRGAQERAAVQRLRNPSKGKSFIELMYANMSYAELTGNGLAWMQGPLDVMGPIPPTRIIPLNPNAVEMLQDDMSYEPVVYRYHPTIGHYRSPIDIPASQILHLRYFNPHNPWWGIGALQAAMLAARTDMKAAVYNERFYENSAQPGGLLLHKRPLTKVQQDQVLKQFNEEYGGERNSHRTAVIGGDWSYQQLGLNQRDMEFLAQRNFSRDQIAACFGVPGILINDPNNSNYSTASIEMRLFADTNWLPKVRLIEAMLDSQYFARFAPRITIRFKVDEAPGLREAFNDKLEQAKVLYSMGVPFADINQRLMLEFTPQDHQKYWWIPISMVPADAETARGLQQVQNDKSILQEKKQKEAASSSESGTAQKGPGGDNTKVVPLKKEAGRADDEPGRLIEKRRQRYWTAVTHEDDEFVATAESKLRRYLFSCRNRTLTRIRGGQRASAMDMATESAELAKLLMPVVTDAFAATKSAIAADAMIADRDLSLDADQILAAEQPFLRIPEVVHALLGSVKTEEEAKKAFSVMSNHGRKLAVAQWRVASRIIRVQAMSMLGVERCMWIARRGEGTGHIHECEMHRDGEIQSMGTMVDGMGLAVENYTSCQCVALPLP